MSAEPQATPGATRTPGTEAGRVLLWALALLALSRLLSLGFYPLMDMTESRYADIARRMVERADWVTPWFTDTQPFWGKPVLSFWATAMGFGVLGISEFAARLPHYLLGAGVAAALWWMARAHSRRLAWHAVALLAGMLLFVASSGAVMTDMALVLGTTLGMAGFWLRMNGTNSGRAGTAASFALFGGLAIGLLAKGPIALVLGGVPIGLWVLWQRRLGDTWRRIPWVVGLLAVAALTLPWYALAELRAPGFLQYFIVGEHWHRFLTPGWTGDLYGTAHKFPRGTIWLYALAAALPWSLLLPLAAVLRPGRAPGPLAAPERRYLLLWALWPCVFFTMSGNILWTYVLPGLPALALLAAGWTASLADARRTDRLLAAALMAMALLIPAVIAGGLRSGLFDQRSMKALVTAYAANAQPGQALLELPRPSFSTSFYSAGKAAALPNVQALRKLPAGHATFVLLPAGQVATLPDDLRARLKPVAAGRTHALLRWDGKP